MDISGWCCLLASVVYHIFARKAMVAYHPHAIAAWTCVCIFHYCRSNLYQVVRSEGNSKLYTGPYFYSHYGSGASIGYASCRRDYGQVQERREISVASDFHGTGRDSTRVHFGVCIFLQRLSREKHKPSIYKVL